MDATQYFVGSRSGFTADQLRWGEAKGRWRRIVHDGYRLGDAPATQLDAALATTIVTDGTASGRLGGLLLGLDTVGAPVVDVTVDRLASTKRAGLRHRLLAPERVIEVAGFRCVDALQCLADVAAGCSDDQWEQGLESALRKELVTIAAIDDELPELGRARIRGTRRIRRVLLLRPPGAPPTESVLETHMVQVARLVPWLPPPVRQYEVFDAHGRFVARVDLAWPELGLFIELDGEHHLGQPVYDASRETDVVATTGWLCGRFTWTEVVLHRRHTARRLDALATQARLRPPRV